LATSEPEPRWGREGPIPIEQDAVAVLVNYNAGPRLGPLLDVLTAEVRSVVVVDNASGDGSVEAIEGRLKVTVVRNPDNRGFVVAANQAAALAGAEWIVFANPDIHLRPGQLSTLLSDLPQDVAEVAPLQVDAAGEARPETAGYEPRLGRYLVWAVVPSRFHRSLGPWLAPPFPDHDTDVDWVSGALAAVRTKAFRDLGGFDEKFFMYHEDVDFGRRLRRAGHRIWVRPSVRLHHEVGHGDARVRALAGVRSLRSIGLDFPPGWRRRAVGGIFTVGHGLRAVVGSGETKTTAKVVLPASRALMRGRLPEGPGISRPG